MSHKLYTQKNTLKTPKNVEISTFSGPKRRFQMCTICVTKPICVYNLCDKTDFGVFTASRAFSLMSHKLYTQIDFVTQIVHI